MATPATLSTLRRGTESRLIIAMIVREDSMTLYGFPDADARDLFLTLIGVSGIGPKIALAALAVYDATALRRVLADGDVTALTRVPGSANVAPSAWCWNCATRSDRWRPRRGRVQQPCGARTGGGSPCRPGVCGKTGRRRHRQGAG